MPEVTVLTAVRNGEKHLPATIASIQAQTFTDWEYIIVDDGSIDDTPRIIYQACQSDHRIKLVRRDCPGGPFIAALTGAEHASGSYIARIDGDDIALPNRIERQLTYLKGNLSLRACATYSDVLTDGGILADYVYAPPETSAVLKWYLCLRSHLVHSSACIERETFLKVYCVRSNGDQYQSFVEEGNPLQSLPDVEDFRMWCHLARQGILGVVPEVLVHLRRHQNRISVQRALEQRQLAVGVLGDHLEEVSGLRWSRQDLENLYVVGHCQPFPIWRGIKMLWRWEHLWRSDPSLNDTERRCLTRISRKQKQEFLRRNIRRHMSNTIRRLPGRNVLV